ncbi:MAG: hypothetical protein ABS69_17490 [Nitrosomonadales bacterium SCN 54-20]|nr:MAG: hypothetical protein ABS69_17490 [Nitrosomonadales bacterium SCN 54-20]
MKKTLIEDLLLEDLLLVTLGNDRIQDMMRSTPVVKKISGIIPASIAANQGNLWADVPRD